MQYQRGIAGRKEKTEDGGKKRAGSCTKGAAIAYQVAPGRHGETGQGKGTEKKSDPSRVLLQAAFDRTDVKKSFGKKALGAAASVEKKVAGSRRVRY